VPPAEITPLRGAKRLEVAQRLGSFGSLYRDYLVDLNTARGRQILGATTNDAAFESSRDAYLRNFRDCLVALRDSLLIANPNPAPDRPSWLPGTGWDRIAATNALAAAQRFEFTVQTLGVPDPALSQAGREVACAVLQALVDERLASLGLDPATGAVPASGGALALYLDLTRPQAKEGLEDLLQYEAWLQSSPTCTAPAAARLHAGIAGAALRLRELVVDALQDGVDRIDAGTPKAWDRAEFVLATAAELFPAITLPQALGLARYPAPTFPLIPRTPGETIDSPRTRRRGRRAMARHGRRRTRHADRQRGLRVPGGTPPSPRLARCPPAGPLARRPGALRRTSPGSRSVPRVPRPTRAVRGVSASTPRSSAPDLATRLGRDAAQLVLNAC
jgi:hypothetical protein